MAPLTAADRCDRCGAPAQARTTHPQFEVPGPDLPLLWCAHHFRDHRLLLVPLLVWQTPEIAMTKEPVKH